MRGPSLFDSLEDTSVDWHPAPLPSLHNDTEVELDFETTGLKWWDGDLPIGAALRRANGTTQYIPWGHLGGGNLPEEQCKEWFRRELRGKRIRNHNIKFEVHMANAWGVDFEEMGISLGDSMYWAALLDDHRKEFSLDAISRDILKQRKTGQDLDKSRMAQYHAGRVAPYACQDVHLVGELAKVMLPEITAQDLDRVRKLEEECIYVTCEMERNAARLDLDLLDQWSKASQREIESIVWSIYRETGLKVDPGSNKDKQRLFEYLKLPITEFTGKGAASFTDAVLKKHEHPMIVQLRRAVRVASLRNKFLVGDRSALSRDGLLRYGLHQLRSIRQEGDEDYESGTVSGRYSSSAVTDDEGVNIQQRIKVAKQRTTFGYDEEDDSHDDELYIIRKLHIPDPGMLWFSSDQMQVEYRYFAHLAGTPAVLEAYKEDPYLSFHKHVWKMVKEYQPDITYRQQKDLNFAKIYGSGLPKMALMLGFISMSQFLELQDVEPQSRRYHPYLSSTLNVDKIYNRVLPEVKPLLRKASKLAEERGYVKTILGRRTRFPTRQRLHKALNGVIQGSCADILKTILIELHKHRKETGFKLRFPVHDEVNGDVPDIEAARKVEHILNQQYFDLKVPILWESSVGPNWADLEGLPRAA